MMEPLTFTRKRVTRSELLLGMGGSFLVHFLVFASAILAVWTMPRKPVMPPFCTVNLVSLKDIGTGTSEPKGNPKAAESDAKAAEAPKKAVKSSERAESAMPVRRLQLDDTPRRQEVPIKKLEPKEAPKVAESPQNLAAIEKNLEKLITKPKAVPRTSTEIQQEASPKPAAAQQASQPPPASRPGRTAPAAENVGHGSPTGSADAGAKGTTVGSTGGTPEGSAAASALVGLYGEKVREAIEREWRLINDQGIGGLKAVLEVQIRKNGEIVQIHIVKPSGNSMFDDSALRAVRKAAPLPAVPEIIVQSSTKLIITFQPGRVS